ncbi:hypothetical protein CGLO_00006 [Colletotrichum gloeosporioides Cg-14]|uniref:Uncharacterized protein n=1 Tax=Colletotrichum gloeosporioides (strain Cg-14) TaxID=1237896 RepID=T0L4B6_COLGC|nr:hypothetical protein CGLO_00006 [Colletotrichum gloeosporioides Cg-14]
MFVAVLDCGTWRT